MGIKPCISSDLLFWAGLTVGMCKTKLHFAKNVRGKVTATYNPVLIHFQWLAVVALNILCLDYEFRTLST